MNRILLLVLLFPCSLFAGGAVDTNGGGHVVVVNEKVALLDLWESGIEQVWIGKNSYLDFDKNLILKNKNFAKISLPVSHKLADISQIDPVLANAIEKTILLYNWKFVDETLAVTEPDDFVHPVKVQQAAVRKGFFIYIAKPIWNIMSQEHQIALVLHESLMALADANQPESRARQINSLIFSEGFSSIKPSDFIKLTSGLLPTVGDLISEVNCPNIFPESFCRKYKDIPWENILTSQGNNFFAPFLVNQNSNSYSPQAVKWKLDFSNNSRWTCGFSRRPFIETEYRAIELNLNFPSSTENNSLLPSKLTKKYSSRKISSFVDSDFKDSAECMERLKNDDLYLKSQEPLQIFREFSF